MAIIKIPTLFCFYNVLMGVDHNLKDDIPEICTVIKKQQHNVSIPFTSLKGWVGSGLLKVSPETFMSS